MNKCWHAFLFFSLHCVIIHVPLVTAGECVCYRATLCVLRRKFLINFTSHSSQFTVFLSLYELTRDAAEETTKEALDETAKKDVVVPV